MDKTLENQAEILTLEHMVLSVKERIRDLEWRHENGDRIDFGERQRALDKLRKTQDELLEAKLSQLRSSGL